MGPEEAGINRLRFQTNNVYMKYDPPAQPYRTVTGDNFDQLKKLEGTATRQPIDEKLRLSHINLGSGRGIYETETGVKYRPYANATA